MTPFKVDDLPTWLKSVHESQKMWRDKNWKKTLSGHKDQIENLLKSIVLLDKWQEKLPTTEPARLIIPEIFSDAWISIHLSCFGLYRYANMCLRSELENTLRLIYFSKHPIEFQWWKDNNDWYRESMKTTDVWGTGYTYFEQLESIKKFDRLCDSRKIFIKIRLIHKKLSKFIHSSAGYFQTRPGEFSPKYNTDEFQRWLKTCKNVQTYVHILLILGFFYEFNLQQNGDQEDIIEVLTDTYYKEKLKELLES